MKRRGGPGIDAAFRSRQARPVSPKRPWAEWTLREDRLLERHYGSMSARELQRRFLKERSLHAVRMRAKGLGLSRRIVHRAWAARERALVRRDYLRPGGLKRLVQALGRTHVTISSEARRLGLYRRRDDSWTAQEDAVLFRLYAAHGTNTPIEGRSKEAIRIRAEKLGLRVARPGVGPRWSAAENAIIRKHRHLRARDLASLLPGRTALAVHLHRSRMRLNYLPRPSHPNLRDRWSLQELEILQQHLWVSVALFAHLLPGRSQNAIHLVRRHMRRRSKVQG